MEGKLAPGEKESVLSKIGEIESWMSSNPNAETEQYEAKQKDIERVFNPIATKMYQGANPEGGARCGNPSAASAGQAGPSVDEVD